MEATRGFVNRSVITGISKQPADYKFATYPEGSILAHVKAQQACYLGAIFRIIKEWHDRGCPRTAENRHDFVEWTQSLDWMVQNLFGLAPLVDGHVDPALSWLRQVGIAVERENRLEESLLASEIVDICQARGVDFPTKILPTNPDQLAMYTGRLLIRVFRDIPANEELGIDRYKVIRESVKQQRSPQAGGDFYKTYYRFRKRA